MCGVLLSFLWDQPRYHPWGRKPEDLETAWWWLWQQRWCRIIQSIPQVKHLPRCLFSLLSNEVRTFKEELVLTKAGVETNAAAIVKESYRVTQNENCFESLSTELAAIKDTLAEHGQLISESAATSDVKDVKDALTDIQRFPVSK